MRRGDEPIAFQAWQVCFFVERLKLRPAYSPEETSHNANIMKKSDTKQPRPGLEYFSAPVEKLHTNTLFCVRLWRILEEIKDIWKSVKG